MERDEKQSFAGEASPDPSSVSAQPAPGEALFFGFNPRAARQGLAAGAVACAALAAWALANARAGTEHFGVVRGGIAAGLMFGFGYAVARLRPRAGWGVTLDALELVVARPFSDEPIRLAWSRLSVVRREGSKRKVLVVFLKTGERILIPQHLFPSAAVFEQVAQALSRRAVPPVLDA
jgi:hypothetical protein